MQLQCGDNYEFMKAIQMTQPWFESLSNTLFEKKKKDAKVMKSDIQLFASPYDGQARQSENTIISFQ